MCDIFGLRLIFILYWVDVDTLYENWNILCMLFSWYTANNDTCPISKTMGSSLTSLNSAYGKQNERNCHFPISYY